MLYLFCIYSLACKFLVSVLVCGGLVCSSIFQVFKSVCGYRLEYSWIISSHSSCKLSRFYRFVIFSCAYLVDFCKLFYVHSHLCNFAISVTVFIFD